ncbi:MAG: exo-alpha-sialidase [Bacteroidia bacterium]|nr:exo-alpha-sialidase [Bacteroidia bacterium]
MRRLVLLFLLIPAILNGLLGQDIHAIQYQKIRPVLLGKEHNVILYLELENKDAEKPFVLEEIYLSNSGTTAPEKIQSMRIYYSKDTLLPASQEQFSFTRSGKESMVFEGSLKLGKGKHYLWMSVALDNEYPLDGWLKYSCLSLGFDHEILSDIKEKTPLQRLSVGQLIRKQGQEGVDTYRIPGLATTKKGTLIAVYDTRRNSSTDLQEDVDVGMSRSMDGGKTWEPMKIIMDMKRWGGKPEIENGIGDPSVLVDREKGVIWVAAIWAHGHPGKRNWWASKPGMEPTETSQFVLVKSEDDGKSWSEPINITSQIKDPSWYLLLQGPGKGIQLKDGTLVFPAQFKNKDQIPHSTLIYSKDHGKTWIIGTGAKSKTTESQIVELSNGDLMLNMRDDRGRENPQGGFRSVAITRDLGKSWEEHSSSGNALPEPVCMGSLISTTYKGEELLLFSNPAVSKGPRRRMTLKVSRDQGKSWPTKYHLLLNEDNSYGYSCLTMIDEETIGILYEGQKEMFFQRISLADLISE